SAVKLFPKSDAIELEGIRAYKRRAQDHPHLVPIGHVGETGQHLYAIMPLADDVKGPADVRVPADYEPLTLQRHLQRHAPLALDEVLTLADHLLAALERLHAAGLLHKDVKPGNVLRMKGGWRLGDMGLTTPCEWGEAERGTQAFWPPEGPRDRTADLYALGKTLYLAWTGAPLEDFGSFVRGSLPVPGTDPRAAALRQILRRAGHDPPARRFPDARAMRQAVARLRVRQSRRRLLAGAAALALGAGLLPLLSGWVP